MKIKVIGEKVLIKPIEEKSQTASGIYIPEEAKEKKKEGIVVDVGVDKEGNKLRLNEGDNIIYGGYSSDDFEIDGKKYVVIEFKDVLAKIEKEVE